MHLKLIEKKNNHNFAALFASRTSGHFQATGLIVFFPTVELHFQVLKCVEIILKFPSLSVITFGGL